MDTEEFEKVKSKIKKRLEEIRALGIRGEKVHHMIRSAVGSWKIKQIEKDLMHSETNLKKLEEDVKNHFVSHAETEEEKVIMEIVAGIAYCYILIRNDTLFEKVHFAHLEAMEKRFHKLFGAHLEKLDEESRKNVEKVFKEIFDEWKEELVKLRKQINSEYEESKGNVGFQNIVFKHIHQQGFMMRQKEKHLWHDISKEDKEPEKVISMLKKVKSKDDLHKVMAILEQGEKESEGENELFVKLIFDTWNALSHSFDKLIKMVCTAAGIHELPNRDSKQMNELRQMIVDELEEKEFHNLREVERQLEGYIKPIKE